MIITIYLICGLLILMGSNGYENMFKSAKSFILGALLILFWPLMLLMIYVDLVDEIKK